MTGENDGTRIEGRIGTPASAAMFPWLWCGILIFFIASGAIITFATGAPLTFNLIFCDMPAGMLLSGAALWRIGTWNGEKDEAAILQFLADHVQATKD